ncbi:hypothetical protein [Saccharospirillum salsuginis]|uniref:Uncharacterized protein n=1 Tax=Saccharospirillum salsuginis TaxID=418750 RepID=A0A918K3J2_9GAMM|nr:hypothetical protein [Saccharospirillum salsuginis]GGX47158.1 hypothetical protein GCM10007392_12460 [Saccharospirillum salsuginis]
MTTQQEQSPTPTETVHRAESLERTVLVELHTAADSQLIDRLGLELPGGDSQDSYRNLLKAGFAHENVAPASG